MRWIRYSSLFQGVRSLKVGAESRVQRVNKSSHSARSSGQEQNNRESSGLPRAEDVWSLHSRRRTGAGDEGDKESKLGKPGRYLLVSPFFTIRPGFFWFCCGLLTLFHAFFTYPKVRWYLPASSVPYTWSVWAHPGDTQEEFMLNPFLANCTGDCKRFHKLYNQRKLSPASQFWPICLCFEVWLLPFTILFLKCIKDV